MSGLLQLTPKMVQLFMHWFMTNTCLVVIGTIAGTMELPMFHQRMEAKILHMQQHQAI